MVESELVGQVDPAVQGEELEDGGVGNMGARGFGTGPAAVAQWTSAVFKSRDGTRVGQAVFGNAAEQGVDAERERVGGGFREGNVRILDDEHEFCGFNWRRRPGEEG